MKLLAVVSSPYSHEDEFVKAGRLAITAKFCQVASAKYHLISPVLYGVALIEYGKQEMKDDWETWKDFCQSLIDRSAVVYVLNIPGWELSNGVLGEIEYARKNNTPVFLVDYNLGEDGKVKILLSL